MLAYVDVCRCSLPFSFSFSSQSAFARVCRRTRVYRRRRAPLVAGRRIAGRANAMACFDASPSVDGRGCTTPPRDLSAQTENREGNSNERRRFVVLRVDRLEKQPLSRKVSLCEILSLWQRRILQLSQRLKRGKKVYFPRILYH